jgi:hypothetical protein
MYGKWVILVLALFVITGFAEKPDSTLVIAGGKNAVSVSPVTEPFTAFQQDQTASTAGASSNPINSRTASLRQLDTVSRAPATNVVVQKNVFVSGFDRFLDMWR